MRNLKKLDNVYYTLINRKSFDLYLSDISKYGILDEKKIRELLVKAKKGDKDSSSQIVLANQRFIISFCKRFSKADTELIMDLINEANIGMLDAIETFDMSKNVKFLSWAVVWVQKRVFEFLSHNSDPVKIKNKNKFLKLDNIKNTFYVKNGRIPSTNELSELYGMELNDMDSIDLTYSPLSLTDDDDNNLFSYNDYDKDIEQTYAEKTLTECMGVLTPKEREVVKLSYGINNFREYALEEIAEKYNMTSSGIRTIKLRALDKLKNKLNEQNNNNYII